MSDWIDNLKEGDEVLNGDKILTVTKAGKIHIICGNKKFSKSTGKDVHSTGYRSRFIRQATDEAKAEIAEKKKYSNLLYRIMDTKFRNLSIDALPFPFPTRPVMEVLQSRYPSA